MLPPKPGYPPGPVIPPTLVDGDQILLLGPLDLDSARHLCDVVRERRPRQVGAVLYLATPGGSLPGAFRFFDALRTHYEWYRAVVVAPCKSAGTLLAAGAQDLVFHGGGELGPLDAQVAGVSALAILEGVEQLAQLGRRAFGDARDAFLEDDDDLSRSQAIREAAEVTRAVVAGLGDIGAGDIGQAERLLRYSEDLTRLALEHGENAARGRDSAELAAHLVRGYPNHGYPILLSAASELFDVTRTANGSETAMVKALGGLAGDLTRAQLFGYFDDCLMELKRRGAPPPPPPAPRPPAAARTRQRAQSHTETIALSQSGRWRAREHSLPAYEVSDAGELVPVKKKGSG